MFKLVKIAAAVALIPLLVACANTYSSERGFRDRADRATVALNASKWNEAFELMAADLNSTHKEKARSTLLANKGFAAGFEHDTMEAMAKLTKPNHARAMRYQLVNAAEVLDSGTVVRLQGELGKVVFEGNRSGAIPFVYSDDPADYGVFRDTDSQRIIFDRSLQSVRDTKTADREMIAGLLTYVNEHGGADSAPGKSVLSVLRLVTLNKTQLEGPIAKLYPDYAKSTLAALMTPVLLKTEPTRRLLEEDVGKIVASKSDWVSITRDDQPNTLTVLIREVQFEERQQPERTQTVIVNDYNVDFLKAALLMPRNASYLYDYAEGSAEIAFAYELIVMRGKNKLYETLIRDSVSDSYHSCANMRVRNVFGGVQAASFWPNSAVESQCAGNARPVRVTDLRNSVYARLATAITEAPPIKEAMRGRN